MLPWRPAIGVGPAILRNFAGRCNSMTRTGIVLILTAGAVFAQTPTASHASNAQSSKPSAQASPASQKADAAPQKPVDSASSIAPAQPVVTAHGVCDGAQKSVAGTKDEACATVLTREQFDILLISLNANNQALAPSMRLKLAQAYLGLLAYADAA